MEQLYKVSGMTCQGCAATVTKAVSEIDGVVAAKVDLPTGELMVQAAKPLPLQNLQAALPQKYQVSLGKAGHAAGAKPANQTLSKLQQLKPLFLIFAYLLGAAILLNYNPWNAKAAMLDFMGLFYIVFSFFKFLDLKGFPKSFAMYDPLAKALPLYGWVYPFLELALGLSFLMRFQLKIALVATIVLLGMTTIGVTKVLLAKKELRCACLGTALNLPMTEATFIENAVMLTMAFLMLFSF